MPFFGLLRKFWEMTMVDINSLETFLRAVETLNFSETAKRLHICHL